MKSSLQILVITFLFGLPLPLVGQAPPPATAAATPTKPADYSKEGTVIERYTTKITFENDGSSVREVSAAALMQSEAGVKEFAVISIPFTSSTEAIEVEYVRVRKADGTVVNTPAYNIQEMPAEVTRVAPMYSDVHEKHVTVKALGVGDTLEYLIRFRTIKPEIPGQFWYEHNFVKNVITKDETLEISAPREKYLNVSSPDLKPETKEQGDRKIYLWKSSHLERKDNAEKELPRRESPRPDVEVTTLRSWEEVGRWYGELQKSQLAITPQIQAKAAEITKGLTTDEQKMRAIYDYVSTHFHYVSLSFGVGRYQPHAADDVLGNEYGDCKDKHTLLATLLKAVSIDAWPVLINSSRKIDNDLPSPAAFDHVITAVPRGNTTVWLDTTAETAPFGLIFTVLRDKQALVIPSSGPPSLMRTPKEPPFQATQSFSSEGKLDDQGVFTGKIQQATRGDTEIIMRGAFRRVPQAQWKELVQRFSYALGFGGDVSDVTATTPEDTTNAFQFSYNYVRKNYADWDNHRITPPLPPLGVEVSDSDDRKPVEPFFLGAKGDVVYRTKLELPSFSKAEAPANVDLVEDFAEYHSRYAIQNNVLTAERRFVIKKPEVELAAWERYTKFRKAIADDENHWINLDGGSASVADKTERSESAKKLQQVVTALQSHDLSKAEDILNGILEKDPKYPRAHAARGQLFMMQGKMEMGMSEFRKEEELNPEFTGSYIVMANVLRSMHKYEEAAEQWRMLLKVQPDNRDAALNASQYFLNEKNYKVAIDILEGAVKATPNIPLLQLRLGSAYLRSGDKEKGMATINESVADKADADLLNDAAWELAEANVELQTAVEFSQKSLQKLEADSPTNDSGYLERTVQYYHFWDTLGWIYFQTGDYEKAASYLQAAWDLSQDPGVGDRLGQAYGKLGKTAKAEHIYKLAFAAASPVANRDGIRNHYRQLTGKPLAENLSTHRMPDGTWSLTPVEELSRMRTFKIPTQSHAKGSATFSVLLTREKIEKVEYISGSEELKPFSANLKSSKLPTYIPPQAAATKIMRRGILVCGGVSCDFALITPQDANSQLTRGF